METERAVKECSRNGGSGQDYARDGGKGYIPSYEVPDDFLCRLEAGRWH